MSLTNLKELLSIPTAPYREHAVASWCLETLATSGVPTFLDAAGNIIVNAHSEADFKKRLRAAKCAPRVFIAHMDHPGFHGVRWKKSGKRQLLVAQWHGGAPTEKILGARVWTAIENGYASPGRVRKATFETRPNGFKSIKTLEIELTDSPTRCEHCFQIPARELFGGWGFSAPVWTQGSTVYTKAADDLVGVYAILELAKESSQTKPSRRTPWFAILSRAEEVGFIGTLAHLDRFAPTYRSLRHAPLFVSLETSRTLPGARLGHGPVVRLGDRWTVFSPGWTRAFSDLAARVLPGKHQRRVMDGGSCEASAAMAHGFDAIGISVPLANYHNQNFEGGPDILRGASQGVAPEGVDVADVRGMIRLCEALVASGGPHSLATPKAAWDAGRTRFRRSLLRSLKLLRY